jgi:hypothetical protein
LNLKKLQQREQKLQQLLNKSERHTKIKEAQAEEAARLKLVRVNLLRDMKQEDKRWRLQMKEKEKTKLEFTATNLRLHNLQQQEILESPKRSVKNRWMAKEKKQKYPVVKCKYGILCRNIVTPNGCKYRHVPCKKGKNCEFHIRGTCTFYHPKYPK